LGVVLRKDLRRASAARESASKHDDGMKYESRGQVPHGDDLQVLKDKAAIHGFNDMIARTPKIGPGGRARIKLQQTP
jgi:hypothetical protein